MRFRGFSANVIGVHSVIGCNVAAPVEPPPTIDDERSSAGREATHSGIQTDEQTSTEGDDATTAASNALSATERDLLPSVTKPVDQISAKAAKAAVKKK